ncbi:MAG: MlaD family protein [Planctomycetota bacterium]
MKVERSEKIRAGLFVLVTISLLVVIVVLVAGLRVLEPTKRLTVQFHESVTGLEVSSIVRYRGVPIGRVASIDFSGNGFPTIDVTIEVDPDAPVKRDTTASLKPQGITGLYYVDLDAGTPGSEILEEGGVIVADTSTMFKVVQSLERMGSLVEDVSHIAKSIDRLLSENEEEIGRAVVEMTGAARKSQVFFDRWIDLLGVTKTDLATTVDNMNTAVGKIDGLVANLDGKVRDVDVASVMKRIEGVATGVEALEAQVGEVVVEFRRTLTTNSGSFARAMGDLRQFTLNLKMMSRELRDQPSRLLFDKPEKKGGRDR